MTTEGLPSSCFVVREQNHLQPDISVFEQADSSDETISADTGTFCIAFLPPPSSAFVILPLRYGITQTTELSTAVQIKCRLMDLIVWTISPCSEADQQP